MSTSLPFRQGVVIVVRHPVNHTVLLGKRPDTGTWQFPQGGIDTTDGESPLQACMRELQEETGLLPHQVTLVKTAERTVRYYFPPYLQSNNPNEQSTDKPVIEESVLWKKWAGQEHTWFLLQLCSGVEPDLSLASDDEFCEFEWVDPVVAVERIVSFKRDNYIEALRMLSLLKYQ